MLDNEQISSEKPDLKIFHNEFFDLTVFQHAKIFQNIEYPWQVLPRIQDYLLSYISSVPLEQRNKAVIKGNVFIEENVIIGQGTFVQHGAMIKGPAIIGKNCQIRKGAYFRSNVILGNDCVIGNSTELKNCIIMNGAQISHFNYVGDSVLGNKTHLAAGAITSNLKLNNSKVVVRSGESSFQTGLLKLGAIAGDGCEVGCNAVLNPGSILGPKCVIYPLASIRGYVPGGHIVKVSQQQQQIVMK